MKAPVAHGLRSTGSLRFRFAGEGMLLRLLVELELKPAARRRPEAVQVPAECPPP